MTHDEQGVTPQPEPERSLSDILRDVRDIIQAHRRSRDIGVTHRLLPRIGAADCPAEAVITPLH